MAKKIVWTLRELTQVMRDRQLNKFDCNFGVSGKRGDGKSTLLFKIFHYFARNGFNQRRHQVYAQKDVIRLLGSQEFGFCWDDEAINSGYKRDFQNSGQKELVKVVTNYRDNYNIYGSALPFFYSLDKDLRELMFMHIHIIQRGVAVILLPLTDQIHMKDPWDTKTNEKIEEKEYKRLERNPNARFRYERFTTFAGFLYFSAMTPKQEERYKQIKKEKRERQFEIEKKIEEKTFYEKLYDMLLDGKLTRDGLIQICYSSGNAYTTTVGAMNKMLKEKGNVSTLRELLGESKKPVNNKVSDEVLELVPKT